MSLSAFKIWLAKYGSVAAIGEGAVDTAELAADAVDGTKIADGAVDSEHIAAGAIDTAHLALLAVDNGQIAANAITSDKIAAGVVIASDIADGTITDAKIATGANLTLGKIAVANGKIPIGNGSSIAEAQTITGDITISNAGVGAIAAGAIVNADVNAAAAIAVTKLEGLADGEIVIGVDADPANNAKVTMSGHGTLANDGAFGLEVTEITAAAAVPDVADMVPFSDESAEGDPTLAATVAELLSAAGDLTALAVAPALDDRVLVTDEDVANDPAKSTTVQLLLDSMASLGDITPVITAAGSDLIPVVDVSATPDAAASATLFEVVTAIAGDGLTQDATDGDIDVDVNSLGTVVAAPSITAAEPDYIAVSDESEVNDPTGKASLFAVLTAAAGAGLAQEATTGALEVDVHEVTALAAVPDIADLVPISDESAAGDPTLAVTVTELLSAAGDLTDLGEGPAVDDRLLLTDESAAGDPAKSMSVANLFDGMNNLTDITPVITAAATDKIPVIDASDTFAKTATLFEVATAIAGDGLLQDATDGDIDLDVQGLGTTVAAPSITAAEPDYIAVSDESEANDPTGKASLFALLTAAAGTGLAQDGTTGALAIATAKYPTVVPPALCHPIATIKDSLPDAGDGTSIGLADAAGGLLTGSTSNTNQKAESLAADLVLPNNYVDGAAIDVRVRAKVSATRANAQTVDVIAKLMGDALGADICETGLQSLTTSYANYDFVITPTGLVAGDTIHVEIYVDSDDTGGSTDGFITITRIELRSTNRA